MQYSQDSAMDSDEDLYITQNSLVSREITESDVLSEQGSDIEWRFDRLLCDIERYKSVFGNVLLWQRGTKMNGQ